MKIRGTNLANMIEIMLYLAMFSTTIDKVLCPDLKFCHYLIWKASLSIHVFKIDLFRLSTHSGAGPEVSQEQFHNVWRKEAKGNKVTNSMGSILKFVHLRLLSCQSQPSRRRSLRNCTPCVAAMSWI